MVHPGRKGQLTLNFTMNDEQPKFTGDRHEIELDAETGHYLHVYSAPRPPANQMKRRISLLQILTRAALLVIVVGLLLLVGSGAVQ